MATAIASVRQIGISARKVRLVADLIRGKRVDAARDILAYTVKEAAPIIGKILESAVANAEFEAASRRDRVDTDEMVVTMIQVGQGTTIRRFHSAPRGRAVRIRKRSSNIKLMISND